MTSKAWDLSNFNMAALKHGSRKFYEIPSSEEFTHLRSNYTLKKAKNVEELFKYIEESCIGEDVTFCGPYGPRKGKLGKRGCSKRFGRCGTVELNFSILFSVTYCDYTASGRYVFKRIVQLKSHSKQQKCFFFFLKKLEHML